MVQKFLLKSSSAYVEPVPCFLLQLNYK